MICQVKKFLICIGSLAVVLVFLTATYFVHSQNDLTTKNHEDTMKDQFGNNNEEFFPEQIGSFCYSDISSLPIPNLPGSTFVFIKVVQKEDNQQQFYVRVTTTNTGYFSKWHDNQIHKMMSILSNSGYDMNTGIVQRYSVIPFLSEFYCVDCLEKKDNQTSKYVPFIFRLKPEEYPKNIILDKGGMVLPFEQHNNSVTARLYNYKIFVTEIKKDNKIISVKIKLNSPGERRIVRENWYQKGDILEFSKFGHRIINIVPPQEIKKEIRGRKCQLIGYVELDPMAIPLEKPRLEEIESLPVSPASRAVLTSTDETEIQTWHFSDNGNKFEEQAAFIELKNREVVLRKSDSNNMFIPIENFSTEDQQLINNILTQREKYSTTEGIQFDIIPTTQNPKFDVDKETLLHIIGEPIELTLKIRNISNNTISVCKGKLNANFYYNILNKHGQYIKSVSTNEKTVPISFNSKDWITLEPYKELMFLLPQNKFANWRLPSNGNVTNLSNIGFYLFSFHYNKLDISLDMQKKLIECGVPAKIFIGDDYLAWGLISIQIIPPPVEMKELLLQKSVKYIERTFSKNEVAEIVKQNGGVDVYSENAKDQIKVFLQLYSLSPIELEKLLIKYSDIEGFDRMESVYRKLSMFNSDESKQTREKMKSVALEKYKKELTDMPIETNNINDDNENDLLNLSDQLTIPKSKDDSSKFWIILIICCFIVTILLVIVIITFRKRKSSPTNPASKL
jgi:hypothetical protein